MHTVENLGGGIRKRLETWGEIAAYLNVEVRTAQRWEKKLKLPIRRLDGSQAVYSFADELDEWRIARERLSEPLVASPVVAPPPPNFLDQPVVPLVEPSSNSTPRATNGRRWGGWRQWAVGVVGAAIAGAGMFAPRLWRSGTIDTFDIVNIDPPSGSVAFGGNVEPTWGVYVTLQYTLRSRDTAWLCIIAEVDPVAQSGSVCGDPVLLRRGTGTARTRVVVTNTTSNGPVLTERLRMLVAPQKICPTVPGNFNTSDASCFPHPFIDRAVPLAFAWTHPGGENRVGVRSVSVPAGSSVQIGQQVLVNVNYLLQGAPEASICVSAVASRDAASSSDCRPTKVRAGFGTATAALGVDLQVGLPRRSEGLRIDMKGLYVGYYPFPLVWR